MQNSNPTSKIRKVNAFPFEVEIKTSAAVLRAQVVKLSSQGFMMEFAGNLLRPGDRLDFTFTLPVLMHTIASAGVVMKIYSQYSNSVSIVDNGGILNLVEIHFKSLNVEQKDHIYDFLRKLQSSQAS